MNLLQHSYWLCAMVLLTACARHKNADLLVYNGHIYTLDSAGTVAEAMVINKGMVVFTGKLSESRDRFVVADSLDLQGAWVYPGFNDAHSHFYGMGQNLQSADLSGAHSWQEVVDLCVRFQKEHSYPVLPGNRWDQESWMDKELPDNADLNRLFPQTPVFLRRVDGHAAIVNDAALKLARLNEQSVIEGGELLRSGGRLSGVLTDRAADSVERSLPKPARAQMIRALLESEKICFSNGLTTVTDAGLDADVINLIDSLQQAGVLHIRIYAMISATEANIARYIDKEPYITDRLRVGSFKLFADGSLGSRGACMLQPYTDRPKHYGQLITPVEKIKELARRLAKTQYQLNVHCIGDSANRTVLNIYAQTLLGRNDRRWRIEHAQVVSPEDLHLFRDNCIIPSMQPVHATSDMAWAGQRIGNKRLAHAYALKELMEQNGWIALGTDFPVESPNPMHTFYAAVARKDRQGQAFMPEQSLTRMQALKGMTLWPAQAAFEEHRKGSLEPGKLADFVVCDVDFIRGDLEGIRDAKVKRTYVGGVKVY